MRHEYEMVSHEHGDYRLFLVNLLYRTPHLHRDFEVSWVLEGETNVTFGDSCLALGAGDVFLANPYEIHEIHGAEPSPILSLQVSPSFFRPYFSEIESLAFQSHLLPPAIAADVHEELYRIALGCLMRPELFELECVARINLLFHSLFSHVPHLHHTKKEMTNSRRKGRRMRRIINHINEHYGEKLLLSDIAEQEGLSLHYLSHLFRDSLGVPFQEYVSRVRCEQARKMLIFSDQSLLDICVACGFSDPKYFNRDFRLQYGCSPKEYRGRASREGGRQTPKPGLSVQDFVKPQEAVALLQALMER